MQAQVDAALDVLAGRWSDLPAAPAALAARVLTSRPVLAGAIAGAARLAPGLQRIRVHGDYQLDQVLVAGSEFVIIDFEGEPLRPIAERRSKSLALKDVAGMARSFSYAAYAALFEVAGEDEAQAERLDPLARWWTREATAAFVQGYREVAAGAAFLPAHPAAFPRLLDAFVVEKAAYELRYEIDHRPRWLRIPLRGMADLLDRLERG
jgi:maltose alpha-D-glucosyltransferase/alpha-amylase